MLSDLKTDLFFLESEALTYAVVLPIKAPDQQTLICVALGQSYKLHIFLFNFGDLLEEMRRNSKHLTSPEVHFSLLTIHQIDPSGRIISSQTDKREDFASGRHPWGKVTDKQVIISITRDRLGSLA